MVMFLQMTDVTVSRGIDFYGHFIMIMNSIFKFSKMIMRKSMNNFVCVLKLVIFSRDEVSLTDHNNYVPANVRSSCFTILF